MKLLRHIGLMFALLLSVTVRSQQIPAKPSPPRLVNDYTNTLTADQQQALERKLVAFDDSTSTQIAVVLVQDLDGADVSDYALKLGREWGVGGKDYNNGVVLLVSIGDRKLNISTGYGVEGALPDVTAKHIIDDVIKPNFKGRDYYRGLDEGTNAIIKAVKGEYKVPRKREKEISPGQIILIIIIVIIFLSIFGRGGGGGGTFMSRRGYRGYNGPVIWGGNWGGGGSSWGGGSSGGGGFGGFGGGSFGGGGASGSW
ncbi:MAG TPA: TPM domain-containing protein [Ferruginibacter sp.]|nr:TPM domain-containing protein [Ferruginibacter sp.]